LTAAPQTAAPPGVPRRTTGAPWLLPLRLIYAAYAGAVFLALALLALAPLAVVPTLAGRRQLIRWVGRAVLTLVGMPIRARWHGPLPAPCIVVANHESYLDGVVLAATLPPRFDFVIKREITSVPLAGFLLRRIGVQFVTRGNRAGSLRDALRVMRSAAGGGSLVFFPEGTFHTEPGLLRFHIVPLVMRGTRHCLAPGTFLPRPGRIALETLAPLRAVPGHSDGAAALRDTARAAILGALGQRDAVGAKE
jgi:1-acyl-sn-glycerol-3-phosphate acyltransferase